MERMSIKWYTTYCTHCINNVYDRDGKIRFTYPTYHDALKKEREGHVEDIDPRIIDLFRNCVMITQKQVDEIEIDEQMETALLLTLINVQVGYVTSSHQLFEIFEG